MISKHRSRKTPPSAVSASLVNIQNPESLLNDNLAVVRSLRPMNKTVESLLVQVIHILVVLIGRFYLTAIHSNNNNKLLVPCV